MASIQTSINLQNNFSRVANEVTSSTNSMMHAMQNLNNNMRDVNEGLANTGNNANLDEPVEALEKTDNSANKLVGTIKRLAGAYLTIQGVKSVLNTSDELANTMARLNNVNDGKQSTGELFNTIYASAQNARGSVTDMANMVARLGSTAKDAFSGTDEIVNFSNLINKSMVNAGVGPQEASNAITQLTQALGSGVLRGDELNSIFEQAPNIIGYIADYMNKPISKIRELAQEGAITSDIVKNAMFSATNDINKQFENMPTTWGQVWTMMQNTALMTFQPVLEQIGQLTKNEQFMQGMQYLMDGLAVIAEAVLWIFQIISTVTNFIVDNWSIIGPILTGIVIAVGIIAAAWGIWNAIVAIGTAIQAIYNSTLLACPLTWIIILIAIAVGAIVAFANYIAKSGGVAQSTFGVICGWINVVIQFFWNLLKAAAGVFVGIWEAGKACGSNIVTAFKNGILNVQAAFYNLKSTAYEVIANIAEALNKLPFVNIDVGGLRSAASEYKSKAEAAYNAKGDYKSIGDSFSKGYNSMGAFKSGWSTEAYAQGAKFGDGISNKLSSGVSKLTSKATSLKNMKYTNPSSASVKTPKVNNAIAKNTGKTAKNTAQTAKAVTGEQLKYLRDIAQRDTVNRFTTATIKVTQTNNNSIKSTIDLDGVTEHLRSTIEQQMIACAEGVY